MPAYLAYQCVSTQWRVGGMGGRTGLDYAGVETQIPIVREDYEAARRGAEEAPEWDEHQVWRDLRVIERTVLQCDREYQEKQRGNQE